jgi:hypothetical protein
MKTEHYARAWIGVGFFTFFYAATAWAFTQGSELPFAKTLPVQGKYANAYIALIVVPVLLHLLYGLGHGYNARQAPGVQGWSVPVPLFDGIDMSRKDAQALAGFFFFLFTTLPLLLCVHFANVAKDANICATRADAPIKVLQWKDVVLGDEKLQRPDKGAGYWIGGDVINPGQVPKGCDAPGDSACQVTKDEPGRYECNLTHKVSWYPAATPIILFLQVTAWLHLAFYAWRLAGKRGRGRNPA